MSISRASAYSVDIVGMARTPFGKFGGALRDADVRDLGAVAVASALERCGNPDVGSVLIGVNFPGSGRSIARQVALRAGLPNSTDAVTVDRACCSSLVAVRLASQGIRAGDTGLSVAGGAENLSRVPYFLEGLRWGVRMGPVELQDQLVVTCPHSLVPRAVQASREAALYGIDRTQQDQWAVRSQALYWSAHDKQLFPEIVGIDSSRCPGARSLDADEEPRRDIGMEQLARLPTVNGSDSVTAGNAPGLSTGATALVLAARGTSADYGLQPLARVVAHGTAAGASESIGSTPAIAAFRALAQAGLSLSDVHALEINEAFAAVPLIATDELSQGNRKLRELLRERTNMHGGSVAVGHPTGASGARLVMAAIGVLRQRGGGIGLIAICGGVAEAEAAVIIVD